MPNSIRESELWKQMKAGSSAALHTIYDTYFVSLYNYGRHLGAEKTMVEDAIQELFIRLWERRQKLGDVYSIKYYLISSIRRELLLRKKENLRWYHGADFEIILKNDLSEEAEITENHQHLLEVLALLNEKQREALYLKFYNGLSCKEIAKITDQKVDTVYKTIARALGVVRKKLIELPITLLLSSLYSFL